MADMAMILLKKLCQAMLHTNPLVVPQAYADQLLYRGL
jgi:hypothetical protein